MQNPTTNWTDRLMANQVGETIMFINSNAKPKIGLANIQEEVDH